MSHVEPDGLPVDTLAPALADALTDAVAAVDAALAATTWARRGSMDGMHVEIVAPTRDDGRPVYGGGALRERAYHHAQTAAEAARGALRAAGYIVRGRVKR